jgi:hypothetical protein
MHFDSASALGEKIVPTAGLGLGLGLGLDDNEIMMKMIHGKAVSVV